ncbi:MAG: chemotaxis protein CheA [Gammaproteobacteria bacterium]|jgi:two-component system chemotaxis sensor kinase CheA|nr:chemotaxis protein CheA [Gammaproteobacteria bacterium]MBT3722636.1 chemotaxis protein CheA [Gammaproteobacteria bacterium]MBT4076507.1 chemotaxis protein CheA [Gammaproteobacteria bacterium]MBT4193044.1 chemotaxis protein CheA [Gammaproteobacteria bacterium]MBT4451453.1 chemotaxis protein CheA [Gammaproteobacteria bacterium]
MAIDLEDDILQDFLIEAGEILETLNEQLVDLEKTPDDSDLLNSIFRGFHTIKGGGSFLALDNLVAVCHKSEDVFNLLRNNEISLNADMMDTFLRVLDEVNSMFEEIKSGEDPTAAPDDIMQKLVDMQDPDAGAEEIEEEAVEEVEQVVATDPAKAAEEFVSGKDEITDEEFESLLDALHGSGSSEKLEKVEKSVQESSSTDEISDDEFEALLDELHGKGASPTSGEQAEPKVEAAKTKSTKKSKAPKQKKSAGSDEISDDEFEALLDDMHGKGKGPTKAPSQEKPAAKPKPKPAVKAAPKKAESKAKPATKKAAPASASKGETTVRVDTARLDDIMNLVGELVLTRNRLNTLRQTFEDERVHKAISSLDVVTADLQTAVMKTRMQPVKKVFGRFPRVVRDLARSLNKEILLELQGEETDLDKNLVEALADPLVHLVRNSVDHGIELPDIREKSGKDRQGKVILSAQQEGDHIILSILDDGAGMDPEVLRANAIKKGLMDSETASRLDDKGCFDLIFMPGLSTKEKISDVSGRGVGMDVVKTKISQLNGLIEINSTLGKGTELRIKVPLTLAILPTLMIQLGTRKFALPLSIVNEIFELSSKKISVVDGKEVVLNRGKAPPIFHLRKWLLRGNEVDKDFATDPHVIMVRVGNDSVGFVVDQVIGQEEVVIKPLDKLLQGLPGMAGSTITGDGNIAIILDIQGLLKSFS